MFVNCLKIYIGFERYLAIVKPFNPQRRSVDCNLLLALAGYLFSLHRLWSTRTNFSERISFILYLIVDSLIEVTFFSVSSDVVFFLGPASLVGWRFLSQQLGVCFFFLFNIFRLKILMIIVIIFKFGYKICKQWKWRIDPAWHSIELPVGVFRIVSAIHTLELIRI